jgi:hypothetical protein
LKDNDLSHSIVKSLLKRAELYTWNETANRMLSFIDEVLCASKNRVDAIWGEAPVPAQIHNSEYLARIESANLYSKRATKANQVKIIRFILGAQGSRRRQSVKKLMSK